MSVLNPDHLVEQAERLSATLSAGPPRQVDLRRAISAAYYAVFHCVLAHVADRFFGAKRRGTPEYALVYRSIDHRTMRDLCNEVKKPHPQVRYRPFIPATGFGHDLPAFCAILLELQETRHRADDDPAIRLTTTEARSAISLARSAIARFERVDDARRQVSLTLLAFPPR